MGTSLQNDKVIASAKATDTPLTSLESFSTIKYNLGITPEDLQCCSGPFVGVQL